MSEDRQFLYDRVLDLDLPASGASLPTNCDTERSGRRSLLSADPAERLPIYRQEINAKNHMRKS
jgi:hypothetical protein